MQKQKGPALSLSKGFTIIELIVVIAIIAVLAGIVLVNVTQYINKSKDAAIKSQLSELQKLAVTIFESTGNYNGIATDPLYTNMRTAVSPHAIEGRMNTEYCLEVQLYDTSDLVHTKWWCVDSTGYAGPAGTADPACGRNGHGVFWTCK